MTDMVLCSQCPPFETDLPTGYVFKDEQYTFSFVAGVFSADDKLLVLSHGHARRDGAVDWLLDQMMRRFPEVMADWKARHLAGVAADGAQRRARP